MNNKFRYFISGKVGIGKSTLANALIEKLTSKYAGFRTLRSDNGFVLKDITTSNSKIIAKRVSDRFEIFPEVFNKLGINSLDYAVENNLPILMDELGRFELTAFNFRKKVLQIASDYNRLIVVIKDERNPFLDDLRAIAGMDLVYLTEDNRKGIWQELGLEFYEKTK